VSDVDEEGTGELDVDEELHEGMGVMVMWIKKIEKYNSAASTSGAKSFISCVSMTQFCIVLFCLAFRFSPYIQVEISGDCAGQ